MDPQKPKFRKPKRALFPRTVDFTFDHLSALPWGEGRKLTPAFWVVLEGDTVLAFVAVRNGQGDATVLRIERLMEEVCRSRCLWFEVCIAEHLLNGWELGSFHQRWSDFIAGSGIYVDECYREGVGLLEDYSVPIKLSPHLVEVISSLNSRGVYRNAHIQMAANDASLALASFREDRDLPSTYEPSVSTDMAQVDLLLRREHPDVFREEPL